MKNELPIVPTPISTYPGGNAMLSIVLSHPESLPWFYQSFIQIYANPRDDASVAGNFIQSDLGACECPFLSVNAFRSTLIDLKWDRFSDFARDCINQNHYVYTWTNRFYIRPCQNYNKNHFLHPILIYGYNDEERIFKAAGFFYGFYNYVEIDYDEVDAGYQNYELAENKWGIHGAHLLYYLNIKRTFQIQEVVTSLEDYLYGRDSTNIFYYHSLHEVSNDMLYGIHFYDALDIFLKRKLIDRRPFHILYEHKKLMVQRLDYISNQFGFPAENAIKAYQDLMKECEKLRNMILKINIESDYGVEKQRKTSQLISELRCQETKVLENLIAYLKEFFHL